jgi:hypothetical protein
MMFASNLAKLCKVSRGTQNFLLRVQKMDQLYSSIIFDACCRCEWQLNLCEHQPLLKSTFMSKDIQWDQSCKVQKGGSPKNLFPTYNTFILWSSPRKFKASSVTFFHKQHTNWQLFVKQHFY